MIDDATLALTAGRDMWSTVGNDDTPSARMADGRFVFLDARAEAASTEGISIQVWLRNDADRPSAAVVQAYREDGALAGFARQVVEARTEASVTLRIDPIALRRRVDGSWRDRRSAVTLRIGASSRDLPLSIDAELN